MHVSRTANLPLVLACDTIYLPTTWVWLALNCLRLTVFRLIEVRQQHRTSENPIDIIRTGCSLLKWLKWLDAARTHEKSKQSDERIGCVSNADRARILCMVLHSYLARLTMSILDKIIWTVSSWVRLEYFCVIISAGDVRKCMNWLTLWRVDTFEFYMEACSAEFHRA